MHRKLHTLAALLVICGISTARANDGDALRANIKKASDNVNDITVNDDGTVTLVVPFFSNAAETDYLSTKSNLDGVCKLYGFSSAQTMGMTSLCKGRAFAPPKLVVLDVNGHFARFTRFSFSRIGTLICHVEGADSSISSAQADTVTKNENGSFVLNRLRFGNEEFTREMSAKSDLDGVCRSFGYSKSGGVSKTSDTSGRKIVLSREGHFKGFDMGPGIEAMVCL